MAALAAVAALTCFTLAVFGLRNLLAQPDVGSLQADLVAATGGERKSLIVATYAGLGRRFGPWISQGLGPRWRAWVQSRLAQAGQPNGYDLTGFAEFAGAWTALGLLGAALLAVQGKLLLAVAIVVLMAGYPMVWLHGQAQRRQQRIERDLPDFLDILAVTVSAGLSFRQALDRVSETLAGPLAQEMARTLHRMDVGVVRRLAFIELRDRNPQSATMGLFTAAILQAEELGAPLTETLGQLATDMRRELSQTTRRRAARAAPRVSLIITMVIVPAVMLLIVTAIILGSDLDLAAL